MTPEVTITDIRRGAAIEAVHRDVSTCFSEVEIRGI
jgi:hypothetical protein